MLTRFMKGSGLRLPGQLQVDGIRVATTDGGDHHDHPLVDHLLAAVPSHCVAPRRIQEAPIAFECVLHEKLETPSRCVYLSPRPSPPAPQSLRIS